MDYPHFRPEACQALLFPWQLFPKTQSRCLVSILRGPKPRWGHRVPQHPSFCDWRWRGVLAWLHKQNCAYKWVAERDRVAGPQQDFVEVMPEVMSSRYPGLWVKEGTEPQGPCSGLLDPPVRPLWHQVGLLIKATGIDFPPYGDEKAVVL